MELYIYEGPVFQFDQLIANNWKARTQAVSENKAYSNIVYQYKVKHKLDPKSKIQLDRKNLRKDA